MERVALYPCSRYPHRLAGFAGKVAADPPATFASPSAESHVERDASGR